MGERAQIFIEDTGVYLYTHWRAYQIDSIVQKTLAKRLRWDDPEYLTRILFEDLIEGEEHTETGFGIGTEQHGDILRYISINCVDQTLTINEVGYPEDVLKFTFDEFIE